MNSSPSSNTQTIFMRMPQHIISFEEMKPDVVFMLYTNIMKCPLNCYQCHNQYTFAKVDLNNKDYFYDVGEAVKKIEEQKDKFFMRHKELEDYIDYAIKVGCDGAVISGGEPFSNNLDELYKNFNFILNHAWNKHNRKLYIRVDTNAFLTKLISDFLRNYNGHKVIRGFAIDIKIPLLISPGDFRYFNITDEKVDLYFKILYDRNTNYNTQNFDAEHKKLIIMQYAKHVVDSIVLINNIYKDKVNKWFFKLRTVKYDLYSETDLAFIKATSVGRYNWKDWDYQVNPFVSINNL